MTWRRSIWCLLVLLSMPLSCVAMTLHWQAPITYTNAAAFDPTTSPPVYRFYTGPNAQALTFASETGPKPGIYPSILVQQIPLTVGQCVAITAVYQGAESVASEVLCYNVPTAPSQLFLTK